MLHPLKSGIKSSRLSSLTNPLLKGVFVLKLKALNYLVLVDTVKAIANFILHNLFILSLHNHFRYEVSKNANPLCIKGLAFVHFLLFMQNFIYH